MAYRVKFQDNKGDSHSLIFPNELLAEKYKGTLSVRAKAFVEPMPELDLKPILVKKIGVNDRFAAMAAVSKAIDDGQQKSWKEVLTAKLAARDAKIVKSA